MKRRVLITGASGLAGSTLARRLQETDEVIAATHRDLDITDLDAVGRFVERERPDVIFNCAVIGVDDCELDRERAEQINVRGPERLAIAAETLDATMVHFSSNYVFDGTRTDDEPYTIRDEARPVNVYGATKLAGEEAVAAASSRAFIIRTSWVFGAGKASFLSTAAQRLARGERISAIVDTFASTTYVEDLVTRVLELLERRHYATYHVVNDGVLSYETFAQEAANLVGADAALIDRATEESLGRTAPRPRWTPMRCLLSERLGLAPMRPWQDALRDYVSSADGP